jgi:uncharacterized membrane protein
MRSSFISIVALIVGGVIVADILIHPAGTKAASDGLARLWSTSVSGLLGK